jgi:hypothetical protein
VTTERTARGPATALRFLLYGAMVLVSVFFLLKPWNDPDFFWHLKNGEWIWQHRAFPVRDSFNATSEGIPESKQRFVLRAYWLSEVVYHAFHGLLGIPGIVLQKSLLALALVLALLRNRRGDPTVHAALVLAFLPLLYGLYPFDRPQIYSFLFFALLLSRLEQERTSADVPAGWRSHLPIPLLMLLWANVHGGHALGQATLLLFVALEGVKFAHPFLRPVGFPRYRRLLIAAVSGLAASFVNPNTYHALQIAFTPGLGWGNMEFLSTVAFFRSNQPVVVVFWGTLALAALCLLATAQRPDITRIVILAGTGCYGFLHVRYVPFFMIAALPVIGETLAAGRARKWAPPLLAATALALAGFFSRKEVPSRESVSAALRVSADIYPVRAAEFVAAANLTGNLYNTHLWGGYLLWRLGPERKVFIDGRYLNEQAHFHAGAINMAFSLPDQSPPYWKALLDQYDINYLVIPRVRTFKGTIFDDTSLLNRALLADPEWVPVFADTISLVYLRFRPENLRVISAYAIPKASLVNPYPW